MYKFCLEVFFLLNREVKKLFNVLVVELIRKFVDVDILVVLVDWKVVIYFSVFVVVILLLFVMAVIDINRVVREFVIMLLVEKFVVDKASGVVVIVKLLINILLFIILE